MKANEVELQTLEPKAAAEPQIKKAQEIKFQAIKLIVLGSMLVDDQEEEFKTVEPNADEIQILKYLTPEHQKVVPQKVVESQAETENVENHNSLQQESEGASMFWLSDYHTVVLWRQPILTLVYFFKELFVLVKDLFMNIVNHRKFLQVTIAVVIIVVYLNSSLGSNHSTLVWAQGKLLWCLYWFSLGMLSSVGLGTGIHTFTLYLGPHIASVTVAANECGCLNFEEDSSYIFLNFVRGSIHSLLETVKCLQDPEPRWAPALWNIMCKVRLESYMWGLGTSVGELPPYFVGRAARISGQEGKTDMLREFEELQKKKEEFPESLTRLDRIKLFVRDLVVKTGFWGILACAVIPNPFFDLAGITCGNLLVPFWTFFGATVIGKTIIKTTIQQVIVILSFNRAFLARVVEILTKIPLIGERFQTNSIDDSPNNGWILKGYHIFVMCTFLYFFISIINSLAQNHYKRLKRGKEKME